jgi:hypothetical protein
MFHGVGDEFGGGLGADLLRDGVLGIVVRDHLVGPLEDLDAVVLRDADEFGDGLEGQFAGDLGDEVEGAGVGAGGLDDRVGAVAQAFLQGADRPWGEASLDDLADAGVLGRVHVEQDQPLDVDRLARHVLAEADDRRVEGRGEDLRVRGDVPDVGVPGHGPVALVLEPRDVEGLRYPAHRLGRAQFGELR